LQLARANPSWNCLLSWKRFGSGNDNRNDVSCSTTLPQRRRVPENKQKS
jgi:hypothetical protein